MEKKVKKIKRGRIWLGAAAAVVVAVTAVTLAACGIDNSKLDKQVPSNYVTLDINPSIELVLDQNNTVMSVSANNADAQILLWQEDGIIGASFSAAVDKIATLSVELNYLTAENNAISVTATANSEINEAEIIKTIEEKFSAAASKEHITVEVNRAVDFVLSKELERIKAANAGKEGYGDTLTIQRYRLVLSALSADYRLTMDEAVLKSDAELIKIVNEADTQAVKKFGDAYEKAVNEARFAFEMAKQTVSDTAYFAIDPDEINGWTYHLTAGKYVALRATSLALDHYYYSLKDLIENPVYTEEDAKGVLNAFGIAVAGGDFDAVKEDIKNADGQITKESVNAYINKVYRNAEAYDKEIMEEGYEQASIIMDSVAVDLRKLSAAINEISESISLKDWIYGQNNAGTSSFIEFSESVTEGTINLGLSLLGIGNDVELDNPDSVQAVLAEIDDAIVAAKAELDSKLTDAQKTRVENARAHAIASIEAAQAKFDKAVEHAREQATAALTAAKEARLNAAQGSYSGDFRING